MSILWYFELTVTHQARSTRISSEQCALPWATTPMLLAILTEYLGTLVLCIVPRLFIINNQTLVNNDATKTVRGMLIGLLVLVLVLLGMDKSGAMFNPTLAAVLVGGCGGYTTLQHFTVYWLAPVCAAFCGNYFCNWVEDNSLKNKKIK